MPWSDIRQGDAVRMYYAVLDAQRDAYARQDWEVWARFERTRITLMNIIRC